MQTPNKQGDDGWKSVLYEGQPLDMYRKRFVSAKPARPAPRRSAAGSDEGDEVGLLSVSVLEALSVSLAAHDSEVGAPEPSGEPVERRPELQAGSAWPTYGSGFIAG
jgi:hypothetical protein